MRTLITGATGFIGRRLVDRLIDAGDTVSALVRRSDHGLPHECRAVRGSLTEKVESLTRAFEGQDIVFHLAAAVSFDPAKLDELLRINGEGTRSVLEAGRRAGVSRVVVVSSACTIGLARGADEVLDESAPDDPRLVERNPYMRSKCEAESYARHAAVGGQHVVIVNPTTVYGPGDRTLNSGTLVRQVAMSRVIPVPPGGSNVVDVDDVVTGIRAAGEHGRAGSRYILGGQNLRFREIVEQIAAAIGRRPVMLPLPGLARLPMHVAAGVFQKTTGSRLITPQIVADTFAYKFYSSALAEAELGWRAQRRFADTVAAAWAYYQREGLMDAPSISVSALPVATRAPDRLAANPNVH